MKKMVLMGMIAMGLATTAAHADTAKRTVTVTGYSSMSFPHEPQDLADQITEAEKNAASEAEKECGGPVKRVSEFEIQTGLRGCGNTRFSKATAAFECEAQ